jgi:hypothetical protein
MFSETSAEGAESVPDSALRLRQIVELGRGKRAITLNIAYARAQQAQADIPP